MTAMSLGAHAQDTLGVVKSSLNRKEFVFLAQSMYPMNGPMQRLNMNYVLTVSHDTLVCDLPYMGRAYQASFSNDVGLKFDSRKFDYNVKEKKKGKTEVAIQVRDNRNSIQLFLTAFEDGSASLRVNSSDRQSISYQGTITPKK